MKRHYRAFAIATLLTGLGNYAFADWGIDNPAELSAAGAVSLGGGALAVVATPLVLAGSIVHGDDPIEVSATTGRHLRDGLGMTGAGIVTLMEGGGKGLSELTENSLATVNDIADSTATTIHENTPRVRIDFPNKEKKPVTKTIPLVVRPGYVQMHEKVETPCP